MRIGIGILGAAAIVAATIAVLPAATNKPPLHARKWLAITGKPLAATAGGKFLPQIGGVLIRDASGAILGAAGASGGTGEEDEAVCAFGIEQAGLVADAKP